MHVACLQLNPQHELHVNLSNAESAVRVAADQGAQVVVLPEMFSFMGSEKQRLATADEISEGAFKNLCKLAAQLKIQIIAGSHSEKSPVPERVYNTSIAIDATGAVKAVYRKIHLFNLRDAQGMPLYCESDVFVSGESLPNFELQVGKESWNALTAICYDLRFPELFRGASSRTKPYDVIFIPAAFTHQTGLHHWEVLLRARAIENQCYIVACNQTGYFADGKKRNFGNSMVVDPWGTVVARLGEDTGILHAVINKEEILAARTRLPALADRKL